MQAPVLACIQGLSRLELCVDTCFRNVYTHEGDHLPAIIEGVSVRNPEISVNSRRLHMP
jgi:hypothetical protein